MSEVLRLGKVVSAVGLKGELKIYPYTDYKEKFEEIDYVLLEGKPYNLKGVRYLKSTVILKLEGVEDRSAAEALKEGELFILKKDAPALPPDTYYVKDLIGLTAVDKDGKTVGRLQDVIIGSAHDIYMIDPFGEGNVFPVPAVEEFIEAIDMDKKIIVVNLIEGLREL